MVERTLIKAPASRVGPVTAVERGVLHMMDNSGQSCNAPSRMLVERPYYETAVEIAKRVAESVKVGLPEKLDML